jgi:hypothetical protein
VEQAQAAMNVAALHLAQVFPKVYKGVGVKVEPLQKGLFGWSAEVFYLLFAAVGFVLLIACTNVANLLLVRGAGRRREIGVRVALGAQKWRRRDDAWLIGHAQLSVTGFDEDGSRLLTSSAGAWDEWGTTLSERKTGREGGARFFLRAPSTTDVS